MICQETSFACLSAGDDALGTIAAGGHPFRSCPGGDDRAGGAGHGRGAATSADVEPGTAPNGGGDVRYAALKPGGA